MCSPLLYAELHAHSAYSFLDGASLPEELAGAAAELGYEAFALTDHNSVSGSMEMAYAARAAGVRAIHGAEVDVADTPSGHEPTYTVGNRPLGHRPGPHHLTLLVQDARGWANLCRILTRAHAWTRADARSGFTSSQKRSAEAGRAAKPPGHRPGPPSAPRTALDTVLDHSEGLVCLTGCAASGVEDEPTARALREAFGRERLRVELQRPYWRDDRARNRRREALARRLELPCVATGNVHAHSPARGRLQDALAAVRLRTALDSCEPERRGNHSHVLASPAAMAARFAADHPRAVAEAARLADRLRFDLTTDLGYRYPGSEDGGADRRLAQLCHARLDDRYAGSSRRREAHARLEEELRVIGALRLAGFFLLHHEVLDLAREVAVEVRGPDCARALLPPGRGRGSSVSSIVCFLIGLSHIDPIANRLALGRFLNAELTSLPDIDLDFPRDVREKLIPRVHERYGRERSALVAAFPTYRARGAIRDLGAALGLPPGEIERVARGSEGWDARRVGHDVVAALGEQRAASGRWPWLAELSAQAAGLPRHLSQHSGGMIIATRPLVDCCPVVPAAMEGRQIAQWDKDSCADAGFLKIDLLGLGMLSAVERCVETVSHTWGERLDLSRIPYDDAATFDAIQRADTVGVFQIESRAQMQSLRRTRPETLDDLTVQVAIVRPGPIQGGAVNPYIQRRERLRADPAYEVPYEHPCLKEVLGETLGTIIFQDQVLEVAGAFAGFGAGEAEDLRRAMSRKRSVEAVEAHHRRFVEGAMALHGVDEARAERVWRMVVGFSGFGFPKAHGAAFGLLAYQSTWLRVHYAPEFLAALLNEQPMGFYAPDALVHDAQRHGIEVRPPDVNRSGAECMVEDGAVRIGLGYVRDVREADVRALVAARGEQPGGRFSSLRHAAAVTGFAGGDAASGRAALECLAWAGACDELAGGAGASAEAGTAAGARASAEAGTAAGGGATTAPGTGSARRLALWELGMAAPGRRIPAGTQLALRLDGSPTPELDALSGWESMLADYRSTGLTTATHPLALLRDTLPAPAISSRDLETAPHSSRVRVGGLVVARQRPATASGVVFVLLEDQHGTINLIVPPPVYERHRLTARTEPLMLATGRLERHRSGILNVLVDALEPLDAPGAHQADVHELVPATAGAEQHAEGRNPAEQAPDSADFRAVAPAVTSFAAGRRR